MEMTDALSRGEMLCLKKSNKLMDKANRLFDAGLKKDAKKAAKKAWEYKDAARLIYEERSSTN